MNYKKLLLHFLGLFLPLFLIVELFHSVDKNNELEDLERSDRRLVEEIGSRIRVDLSGISADLLTLSQSPLLLDYVENPDEPALKRLEQSFLTFSASYGKYDQVRFIDRDGRERIRVNHHQGKARLIDSHALQNRPIVTTFPTP